MLSIRNLNNNTIVNTDYKNTNSYNNNILQRENNKKGPPYCCIFFDFEDKKKFKFRTIILFSNRVFNINIKK